MNIAIRCGEKKGEKRTLYFDETDLTFFDVYIIYELTYAVIEQNQLKKQNKALCTVTEVRLRPTQMYLVSLARLIC